jgi:hypothetical protein
MISFSQLTVERKMDRLMVGGRNLHHELSGLVGEHRSGSARSSSANLLTFCLALLDSVRRLTRERERTHDGAWVVEPHVLGVGGHGHSEAGEVGFVVVVPPVVGGDGFVPESAWAKLVDDQ